MRLNIVIFGNGARKYSHVPPHNMIEFSLKLQLDELWNEFESIFNNTVFLHAPLRQMTRKEKRLKAKPWLTKGILTSIRTKDKMFVKEIKNKNNKFSRHYKRYRSLLTRVKDLSKNFSIKNLSLKLEIIVKKFGT